VRGGSILESQTPPARKHGLPETYGQLGTIEKNSLKPLTTAQNNQKLWQPTLIPYGGLAPNCSKRGPAKAREAFCLFGNSHGDNKREISFQSGNAKIDLAGRGVELSPSARSRGASFLHL
jgi:hypothetical protein